MNMELEMTEKSSPSGSGALKFASTMPLGEPIGTLKVPRSALSAVVAEGDDKPVLDDAAGHLPDTALPWNDGNTAVAAHRDGLFRPLKGIKIGEHPAIRDRPRRFRIPGDGNLHRGAG